ncbi:formin-like protein 8 [Glycine soja]|uniref:formin-like protein 8 n=1 Tax=Glycine max TaxID=3847 RepID=UPI0003DE7EDB|nr:formin-like protein 8 [Glycine max]XP_028210681.1 formin-like protein 8 [Glycine soja]|eukprot:XP_006601430.1 formin-like protein 8 [Glycine max]
MHSMLAKNILSAETLEKLAKIAPTQEEAKIMQFSDNPDKLVDAESFLYHILRAVPTAFIHLKALLIRSSYGCEVIQLKEHLKTLESSSNSILRAVPTAFIHLKALLIRSSYGCEVIQLKEHLKTLEMGCNEMKTSSLLLKFLKAILKAGNPMNVGTSRGNAHAQFEARQQASNQKHNLNSSTGETSNTNEPHSDNRVQKEEVKEYLVLGGLRDELCEVKKAASIEHQNFSSMYSIPNAYVTKIRQIITCFGNSERGGFIKVMKGFPEECEVEPKVVREEQEMVMELLKKTNEYYLTGGSKDNISNPFQLFITVKEFLDMVDEVCKELRRQLEKTNAGGEAVSTPPLSPSKRAPLRLTNFNYIFGQARQE